MVIVNKVHHAYFFIGLIPPFYLIIAEENKGI